MSQGIRRHLGWSLRLLVSLALLVILFRQLPGIGDSLRKLEVRALWPAALAFGLSSVLGAWQWTLILRHAGVKLSSGRLARLYWIGLFANNFLPGNVGGDVVKVADVAVSTGRISLPLAGTLLDRVLGLLALVSLALVGAAVLGGAAPAGVPWWLLVILALPVAGVGAGLLSRRLARGGVQLLAGLRLGRMGQRLAELAQEFQAYRLAPGFILRILALALVVQALRILTHVAVADAMGIPLTLSRIFELFVLIPVLGLAMAVPISFNGAGVREKVATELMPAIGIVAEEAAALELATYLVQVAVSMLGGVFLLGRLIPSRRS